MKPKQHTITINEVDRLFVIGCGAGYSCLGFDVCHNRSVAMAEWLGVEAPSKALTGTIEGYNRFSELVELCRVRYEKTGVQCPCELTPELVGLEGSRVEVVDKWGEKRRFKVGRSTGWIPCHIELFNSRSNGGPAVMGAPFQSLRVVR